MANSRFSVISDEVSQDPSVVARFVRDFQLNGFELRSMFGRAFKDLTPGDIDKVRAMIRAEGWRIHGCATPVFKCELGDSSARKEHLEIFRRSLEVAGSLECRLLRVFTFLRSGDPLNRDVLERICEHLQVLAELAARAGVRIGIENESSCRIGSGLELAELARFFSHPAAGWIWDPCNVLYVPGESGGATDHYGEFARGVIHIHVKDAVRTKGAEPLARATPIGDGEVGWNRHLGEIGRFGYDGLFSLETHWRRTELDKNLLHLPAGEAFSAGGEEASRICLARLTELWSSQGAPDPRI
ncbi:MAG TPA: sugar phosphate isomerase/epimerase family protein [Opitutaceae bacterium]|jgi:sugar phosphate isomerase/epimerase